MDQKWGLNPAFFLTESSSGTRIKIRKGFLTLVRASSLAKVDTRGCVGSELVLGCGGGGDCTLVLACSRGGGGGCVLVLDDCLFDGANLTHPVGNPKRKV
jgi:hypothetical protein